LKINSSTGLYCLLGNPVEKSLSPEIHNSSFEINEIEAVYTALEVKSENLNDAVKGIKALGIRGFNVTIPHKIDIIPFLDSLDEEAALLGAVNTVKNTDGVLKGYNTDGKGFIELLKSNGIELKEKKVIILGAGGAARAIAISLGLENVGKILVLNRTVDKAKVLAEEILEKIPTMEVEYRLNSNEDLLDYDLAVNCTSIGMYPNTDQAPLDISLLDEKCVVADIVYKPLKTKFLELAEKRGHKTVEGLGMLINQALLSEEVWFDRTVEKKEVLEKLKEGLSC
jgi:shikimate dehydrogenase